MIAQSVPAIHAATNVVREPWRRLAGGGQDLECPHPGFGSGVALVMSCVEETLWGVRQPKCAPQSGQKRAAAMARAPGCHA
eukprot:360687-Chlamydomonas_euryale.AAC.2